VGAVQACALAVRSYLLSRRRALLVGAALLLGLTTLISGAGVEFDRLLRNMRDSVRSHPASGEVVIVEIDGRSLSELNRWPWPRSNHAAAIDRLHQAGARSIAFDVDFSAISDPREDAILAAALARAGRSVILPTLRQRAGSGSAEEIESVPIKPFADNSFLAAVNVRPDGDGYVRAMPLGVETQGTARPSLASMIAEKTAEIGREFDIDYSIDPASIPRHSMVDLIRGNVPPAALAGKRVLIGATAVEIWDRYAVPRHGVIPGVVIQALGAETLMQGPVPERKSGIWPLLIALVAAVLASRPGRRRLRIGGFVFMSLAVLLTPLLGEALWATSFPIAPALAALFGATAIGGGLILTERLQRRAMTDPGTALPNLAAICAAAEARPGSNIIVARIDRFATIASGLGPDATANLILRVADRLRFGNHQATIYRTDDATLAWIEDQADEADLDRRIEAVAAVMRSPVDCGRLIDVALTFGLSGGPKAPQQVVAQATFSASQAAQAGRHWQRFTEADGAATDRALALLGELDTAMAEGQLWNAYQPKLDLATGRIVGAEALVRWQHPSFGLITPDQFIPMMEEHKRVGDLTVFVLEQAIDDALGWAASGHPISVAVNVSATLLTDHGFIDRIAGVLQTSRLPKEHVTIEVTESAAMHSPERAIAALESWRALGVNISIDDYGTGQSSLGYLQMLPATELKIDKSFVQSIGTDRRNAIMVRSTIALAHELGMKVVAEGIEDEACLELLRDMGCDTAQGYQIARPMSAQALANFLADGERLAA
jgi:EAL domain-containing protein (putative c-di-GMP-specific phosphodiesterase class I)/CHASE2 domain-containing sensor protein/GGDEF domain-containing protein